MHSIRSYTVYHYAHHYHYINTSIDLCELSDGTRGAVFTDLSKIKEKRVILRESSTNIAVNEMISQPKQHCDSFSNSCIARKLFRRTRDKLIQDDHMMTICFTGWCFYRWENHLSWFRKMRTEELRCGRCLARAHSWAKIQSRRENTSFESFSEVSLEFIKVSVCFQKCQSGVFCPSSEAWQKLYGPISVGIKQPWLPASTLQFFTARVLTGP